MISNNSWTVTCLTDKHDRVIDHVLPARHTNDLQTCMSAGTFLQVAPGSMVSLLDRQKMLLVAFIFFLFFVCLSFSSDNG